MLVVHIQFTYDPNFGTEVSKSRYDSELKIMTQRFIIEDESLKNNKDIDNVIKEFAKNRSGEKIMIQCVYLSVSGKHLNRLQQILPEMINGNKSTRFFNNDMAQFIWTNLQGDYI